jgi:hypothetical protein
MTVSSDGRLVCTDPGVGIPAPGWHGTSPAASGGGGGPGGGPGPNPPGPDNGCNPAVDCCDAMGGGGNDSNPMKPFSGEKYEQAIDLRIPGVGMDLSGREPTDRERVRRRRKATAGTSRTTLCLMPSGEGLAFCNGGYRQDVYLPTPVLLSGGGGGGGWRRQGPGAEWILPGIAGGRGRGPHAGDGGRQGADFHPFDGSAVAGKIQQMTDRNGNVLRFLYDSGRPSECVILTPWTGRSWCSTTPTGSLPRCGTLRALGHLPTMAGTNGREFWRSAQRHEPRGNWNTERERLFQGQDHDLYLHEGFCGSEPEPQPADDHGRAAERSASDPTFGEGPYLVNVYSTATNPE